MKKHTYHFLASIIFLLPTFNDLNAQINSLWLNQFDARDIVAPITNDAPAFSAVYIDANCICRYDTIDISSMYNFNVLSIVDSEVCNHKWVESEIKHLYCTFNDICNIYITIQRRICSICPLHQELIKNCEKPILHSTARNDNYELYLQYLKN